MKSQIILAFLIGILMAACNGTARVGIEQSPTSSSGPVSLASPTPTQAQPALRPSPTDPPATLLNSLPSVTVLAVLQTSPAPAQNTVKIFLIAVNDSGQSGAPVGCGDSAVPAQIVIPPKAGTLKAAVNALLSIKDQYYGQSGLYNALYQSNLQLDSASINNGIATVSLSGTLSMGGECDTPRVQAQLEQTILQFPTVKKASIFVNGKPLQEVLSLKGTELLPASTSPAPTQNMVKIFLIAMNDNGKSGLAVGCGDSVVPVQVGITPTAGVLKAALAALLAVKTQNYGQSGLYNALYQSALQVESVNIASGRASVYLTGTLKMGGECDNPRVQAQLLRTVLQFPTVTEAAIFVNGKPLAEALSLK
jgi:Sporulation and spore germination